MYRLVLASALALAPLAGAAAAPVAFAGSYGQNFDGLGPNGTTLTTLGVGEWTVWRFAGGAPTWTDASGVIASDLSSGVLVDDTSTAQSAQAPLGKFYNPSFDTFTRFGGVNASRSTDPNDVDRWLGTSPTGTAGHALQLALTNSSGGTLNALTLAYQVTNLSVAADQELAGYRFFYSLTGETGTWVAVSALDTVTTSGDARFTLRNTGGTLGLAGGWTAGSTLLLRFVDDNTVATSPDQMLAIDNVSVSAVTAVPEPSTWAMLVLGFGLAGAALRRRARGIAATA